MLHLDADPTESWGVDLVGHQKIPPSVQLETILDSFFSKDEAVSDIYGMRPHVACKYTR